MKTTIGNIMNQRALNMSLCISNMMRLQNVSTRTYMGREVYRAHSCLKVLRILMNQRKASTEDATLIAENVHARICRVVPCECESDGAVLVLFPPRPLDTRKWCTAFAFVFAMPDEKGAIATRTQ